MTLPVLSIRLIDAYSGRGRLNNQFHVTRTDELPFPIHTVPVKGDHFVIVLSLTGETKVSYNLKDYILRPNDMFILSPAVIHQFDATDGLLLGAGFTKEFFSEALIHQKHIDLFDFLSPDMDPFYRLSSGEAENMHRLMLMLRNYYYDKGHTFHKEVLFHSFNLFMLEAAALIRKYRLEKEVRAARKSEILTNFLKLLSQHYREERSVQFYAHRIFVSAKHLTKMIKQLTGKTVSRFIDEMLLADAKMLLDFPNLTVANIADQLNFSNQFAFSKFFKKQTGMSPSQYRSKIK